MMRRTGREVAAKYKEICSSRQSLMLKVVYCSAIFVILLYVSPHEVHHVHVSSMHALQVEELVRLKHRHLIFMSVLRLDQKGPPRGRTFGTVFF